MAFRNINFFGEVTERKQIRENLIWFLRDQLLTFGAYYNMGTGVVDPNNRPYSRLFPSYQPEYTGVPNKTTFFKGYSNNWVWESGVTLAFSGTEPIPASGLWVGTGFIPAASSGNYAHYIDYQRGGVVFNTAVSTGTIVNCYRTERAAFVYSSDSNELRRINTDHLKVYQQLNYPVGSGFDAVPPEYSTFLPAVFVDVKLRKTDPYELGNSIQWRHFDVTLDIVATSIDQFDILHDICTNLQNQTIWMFDVQDTLDAGKYPLDYLGRLKSDAMIRSTLLSSYPWRKGRFLEDSKEQMYAPILPVHRGTVKIGFEVIL